MEPAFLIGGLIWCLVALAAGVLWLALFARLANRDTYGHALPWQALFLTLLAVWFIVDSNWDKLHLLWAAPLLYAFPPAVFLSVGRR
jgi:hypothetical protein